MDKRAAEMDKISERRVARLTEPSPTGRLSISNPEPQWSFGPKSFMRRTTMMREMENDGILLDVDYSAIEQRVMAHHLDSLHYALGGTVSSNVQPTEENTLTIDKLKAMMAKARELDVGWNTIVFTPYVKRQVIRWRCLFVPWEMQFNPLLLAEISKQKVFAPTIRIGGVKGSRGRRIQRLRAVLRTRLSGVNMDGP
jgi:hypothetical protein